MSLLASMPWWAFAIAALLCGIGAAMLAFLGLSAGTAYGTDYHTLSDTQRRMAKLLALGAVAGALAFGLLALALATWTLHLLL